MAPQYDFNVVAHNYERNSSQGIWGYFKSKEIKAVLNRFERAESMHILDVGCGPGIYAQALKQKFPDMKITGIDPVEEMIALFNQKKFHGICVAAENFRSKEKYNYILILGVLEFSEKPEVIIHMAQEHLEKNGRVLVLVPRLNPISIVYFLIHFLRRNNIFPRSLSTYRKIFARHNLRIVKSNKTTLISHLYTLANDAK